MRREDTLLLNAHYLRRRIEVLDVRQWWLAGKIGVDRKTVSRWATGKVKRITKENVTRLAECLGCRLDELVERDAAEVFATAEDQQVAARLLDERDLLQMLSPSGEWKLAESLIKATMQPNLPLSQLGRLYNLLSITSWRQGRYADGATQAERARAIGKRLDDRGMTLKAVLNLATIDSIRGNFRSAERGFAQCLEHPEYLDTQRDYGALLSNTAALKADLADFEAAIEIQEASIAVFKKLGLPLNLAISYISLALALTECGRFEQAVSAIDEALVHSDAVGYLCGLGVATVRKADILSLTGRPESASEHLERGFDHLESVEIHDLGVHEVAARVARRAGDLDEAGALVAKAQRHMEGFASYRAALHLENARLALARRRPDDEAQERASANSLYEELGATRRMRRRPVVEHGRMFCGEASRRH